MKTFLKGLPLSFSKKTKSAIIPISVGQPYHEGEIFKSALSIIDEDFKSCLISICDTLQRHTIRINNPHLSQEEINLQSFKNGDNWLQRNQTIITNTLSIPCEIVRWDSWLKDKGYLKYELIIKELYEKNKEVKEAFNETANKFYERSLKRDPTIKENREAFIQASLKYVCEECAVIPIWFDTKSDVILYPKPIGPALKLIVTYFQKEFSSDIIQPVTIVSKKT